jgi:hypothetical protein
VSTLADGDARLGHHGVDHRPAFDRAKEVRKMARNCGQECWMIGSVAPEIKKRKLWVLKWILQNKWSY